MLLSLRLRLRLRLLPLPSIQQVKPAIKDAATALKENEQEEDVYDVRVA